MPKLFAKLCKNTIFPLTSSSSSSASSSRSRRNRSQTATRNDYATSSAQNDNNSAYHPENQSSLSEEQNPIRREPPPPYWEHHNHRVLLHQQQPQNEQSRQGQPPQPQTPPPQRLPSPPLSPPVRLNEARNHVIQFNDSTDDDDDNDNDNDDDIYSDYEYNYEIRRNNLNYSDDIFCPDLVRNCAITNDARNGIEPDPNTPEEDELLENLNRISIANQNTKEDAAKNAENQQVIDQMGQNLSLRRPKISLTWVLREQNNHNQQQHHHHNNNSSNNNNNINNNNNHSSSLNLEPTSTTIKPNEKKKKQSTTSSVEVPKYQSTQATTKTTKSMIVVGSAAPATVVSAAVASPPPPPPPIQSSLNNNNNSKCDNILSLSELKLRANHAKLCEQNETLRTKICENLQKSDTTTCSGSSVVIKGTYSEPSLYTTVSDANNFINSSCNNSNNLNSSNTHRHRHRQRKRKDRNRSQRFGYEIKNVDDFLSKCSLTSPANIPVVLSASSTLYQTRPGGYQIELPLPLGMVVNAVFKNQNWLYVQTPHAEEGYVNYSSCLPLGILPPLRSSPTSRPPPCWENSGDVFPRPCGNMTDSEKEQLRCDRGGTRSEGARTPKLRRTAKICSERNVDALYLRAASQPKLSDKSNYAQLKPTNKFKPTTTNSYAMSEYGGSGGGGCNSEKSNDEYISLHQPKHRLSRTISNSTNLTLLRQNYYHTNHHHHQRHPHNHANESGTGSIQKPVRQTLLAITENYINSKISVRKGDVVILIASKDFRIPSTNQIKQWFYVKTREDIYGLIPAEVAGHGFL